MIKQLQDKYYDYKQVLNVNSNYTWSFYDIDVSKNECYGNKKGGYDLKSSDTWCYM